MFNRLLRYLLPVFYTFSFLIIVSSVSAQTSLEYADKFGLVLSGGYNSLDDHLNISSEVMNYGFDYTSAKTFAWIPPANGLGVTAPSTISFIMTYSSFSDFVMNPTIQIRQSDGRWIALSGVTPDITFPASATGTRIVTMNVTYTGLTPPSSDCGSKLVSAWGYDQGEDPDFLDDNLCLKVVSGTGFFGFSSFGWSYNVMSEQIVLNDGIFDQLSCAGASVSASLTDPATYFPAMEYATKKAMCYLFLPDYSRLTSQVETMSELVDTKAPLSYLYPLTQLDFSTASSTALPSVPFTLQADLGGATVQSSFPDYFATALSVMRTALFVVIWFAFVMILINYLKNFFT